jgi:hypothetical protein
MVLLDIGDFAYLTPEWVNILSHTGLMLAALYLSARTIGSGDRYFATAFVMFALGEAIYMTYHFGLTELLFVYLVGDGLVFMALVIIFVGLVRRGIIGSPGSEHSRASTVHMPGETRISGGN